MASDDNDTISLEEVMNRVISDYKSEGKSKISIEHEAAGSADFAERVLQSAAKWHGVSVSTTTGADHVYARVDSQSKVYGHTSA